LNITYLPVLTTVTDDDEPADLLARYDYSRAKALLSKLPGQLLASGPYLISTLGPLSQMSSVSGNYLLQDLRRVPPGLVDVWFSEFEAQASLQEFWKKRMMPNIVLELRTNIEIAALALADVKLSASEVNSYVKEIVWKSK
jgi:hypothetical protein